MIQEIPGITDVTLLAESSKSQIYRAYWTDKNQPVIIKTLKEEYPSRQQIARLQHEYAIHHSLNHLNGVAQILQLINVDNKPALIIEFISGRQLAHFIEPSAVDFLDQFFLVAIQLAQTLGEIHQQNIIHKDINPYNILWDPDKSHVKIIDFGLSTELSREKQSLDTNLLRGSLAYISPEQTGRMNRAIDYRTDLYSLGVTFYQLISGELPFDVEDESNAMSWVHSHIAREPKPLGLDETVLGKPLAAIIFKLMAKNAEDRYQSAFGLKEDLEFCYTQWQEKKIINDFVPGCTDFSDRFQIHQKLYGREKEVKTLLAAFSDVSEGACKMFLVSGYSGIGKSALIYEVHKPIVAKQGFFISGKFDQFQRNIPYSAMSSAFRGLMKQLLAESPQLLEQWKEKLLAVVGPNGQVLIDFIPELERIIGPQKQVAHLGTEENQNRFNRVAIQFLQLFTSQSHPLVLFIDDLQWVDSASLNLIKLFMSNNDVQHFLFIGAYRDNEVQPHHPFIEMVLALKKANVSIIDLVLDALKHEHINALVSESFSLNTVQTMLLSQLVLDKTAGNPFFINQFLRNLYETSLLTFDIQQKSWIWDLEKIKHQQSSENVVDLVLSKMARLSDQTRHLLTLAACIGNVFDLHTLSIISQTHLVKVAEDLWPAVMNGFLLIDGDGHVLLKGMAEKDLEDEDSYPIVQERFLHDRVQQAAYSLINEDQKQQVHLLIARLLLKRIPEHERKNANFDIVEHYNKSHQLIESKQELQQLAELNISVGWKAKEATAYLPALQYFEQANWCYESIDSKALQRLGFEIDKGRVECFFLLGKIDQGLQLAETTIEQCETIENKVEINNLLILYYGGAGQMDKAIDIALDSLRFFSVKIPRNPNKLELIIELLRAKVNLGNKSSENLMALPLYTDQNIQIVFSLLKELIAPTYLQGLTNLLPYIILRMFNLTLKHGNGPVASFTYSGYALLWSKLDDFAESYRFGVLAMDYNNKIDNPPMEARCYFMATSFALYWKQAFKDSQQPRKVGLQKLIDTGENFWASYIYLFGFWQEVVLSTSLDDVFMLTEREIEFAEKAKQTEPYFVHTMHRNLFKNFAGSTLNKHDLDIKEGEEQQAVAYFEQNVTSTMGKFYHVVCRLLMHFYQEQYQQAVDIATQEAMHEDVIRDGTYTRVIYTFFTCLSILALATKQHQPRNVHPHYRQRKSKMKQWYTLCPENFSCMWWLILAEEARTSVEPDAAIKYYENALQAATSMQSVFFESLVNELYAKFWLFRGNQKVAAVFMVEAGYLYYRWGAEGKLEDLKIQYSELFISSRAEPSHMSVSSGPELLLSSVHSSSVDTDTALDVKTLVQASQALSGELVMEKLLQKLMQFLIENAGAQKGMLILKDQGKLIIETECLVEKGQQVIKHTVLELEKSSNLSIAIVHYVERTKELLVLDEAVNDNRFGSDQYVQTNQVKSVLCLPLLNKKNLTGILYLENNLANNTFTPNRVETLKILSAEIVISLENARLYRNLEEYNQTLEETVKQRTGVLRSVNETLQSQNTEIQESKKIIEQKNNNITKSILYAQNIQNAMLPKQSYIADQVDDFFVIFKPKEIVSGDFYWINSIAGKVFVIVADCTGHGVPGAFLSMIGNMLLNTIIIEKNIHSPALILNTLHKEIRKVLKQEGKTRQANDGMDIAVCNIDFREQLLVFSGARRPLYIFQKNGQNLLKIAGDRKSIGGRQKEQVRSFSEHMIRFSGDDMLYLCSDGFVDQHDRQTKKFGSVNLEKTFYEAGGDGGNAQRSAILQKLKQHQGGEFQRDDITLLGLRLNAVNSPVMNSNQNMSLSCLDLLNFRKTILESNIVLSFEGKMSQGVLIAMVDTLIEKLKSKEWDATQQLIRKIFAIFVELAQNIQHHSMESVEIDGNETGVGIIIIREDAKDFTITSGNQITTSDATKLKKYCQELNELNSEQLKQYFKRQLRTKRAKDAKGAGIGLIEIRRKSNRPLQYEIQAVDPHIQFFSLSVSLAKEH